MEAHRNDQAESTHSPKRLSDSEIPIFGGGKAISLRNNADDDDDLFVPGNEGMDIDPPVQASQVPEEDDLDTFLAEQESTMQNTAHGLGILKPNAPPADEEDDLDALLAEAENTPARAPKTGHLEANRPAADDFDDELHILNEFGLEQSTATIKKKIATQRKRKKEIQRACSEKASGITRKRKRIKKSLK
ncbi:hypothetical protein CIHG_08419 [Coccidioides immitis H538.4]|uniref:Uncharacterized protein n=1 Tax=Coccidioides immitis H538.4 TaxID=396776 RepID=A0A0J8RZC1_COCIT|nr:hypothetical protein CIHG_08419 [Coccidioides immitis H538.4]